MYKKMNLKINYTVVKCIIAMHASYMDVRCNARFFKKRQDKMKVENIVNNRKRVEITVAQISWLG